VRVQVIALVAIVIAASLLAAPPRFAISEQVIGAHLSFLAGDETAGRRTGEKGNELAARYIAEQFRRVGLEPVGTSRQRDPHAKLNGTGYFQPWTFVAGSQRGKANSLEATIGGRRVRYRVGVEFEPSPVSSDAQASGELVFAGYGTQNSTRDDYAGLDPKGKVVLVLTSAGPAQGRRFPGFELQRKVQTARDLGAAGLLVAMATDSEKPVLNPTTRPSDSGLPVLLVRRSVAKAWLKAAGKSLDDVEKALADAPQPVATGVQVTLSADVDKLELPSANIIGLLPGSDSTLSKEYVVIGAHMDHLGMGGAGSLSTERKPAIHHGADDNASGTAGVLALAEHFATSTTRPKRSILFMTFSGEELGLLGSAHYVKNPIVPIESTVAMLNMDMIGRMKDNKLTVIGVGTSPTWNPLLDELNRTASFSLTKTNAGFGGSDHQSFARANVPVLFFFTGMHPDYHRPSDTFDKIALWDETRIVRFVADIAGRIANGPARPVFSSIQGEGGDNAAPRRTTLQASLGIMPEYSDSVVGVPVGGLRTGGPAEKAGIKTGDVVVKIGDKSIRNIEEYMAALAGHKAGDTVSVTVKRNGQEVTVSVVLAESRR
jgi:hypothetical protein